jgi:hypothetical protein
VSGDRRPSKAVLTVCAEIEGDARDSIAMTVYAAEQIHELRKMVALAAVVIERAGATGTLDGSSFLAFARRTAARGRRV